MTFTNTRDSKDAFPGRLLLCWMPATTARSRISRGCTARYQKLAPGFPFLREKGKPATGFPFGNFCKKLPLWQTSGKQPRVAREVETPEHRQGHRPLRHHRGAPPLGCHCPAANFTGLVLGCIETKYAFESSRRDLHNARYCIALESHFF